MATSVGIKPRRKIVNITTADNLLWALCDDGSVWFYQTSESHSEWQRLPTKRVTDD